MTEAQRSSSMVTLARPPTHSYVKITNRSFRYAAPSLWNELPSDLREPRQTQSPALSPITHGISSSSPSSLSPLASSLLAQCFILNSRLGSSANPFLQRPFPLYYRTDYTDYRTIYDFTLLNGCTSKCVRLSRLLAFECSLL